MCYYEHVVVVCSGRRGPSTSCGSPVRQHFGRAPVVQQHSPDGGSEARDSAEPARATDTDGPTDRTGEEDIKGDGFMFDHPCLVCGILLKLIFNRKCCSFCLH